jgi:hypothetical protein
MCVLRLRWDNFPRWAFLQVDHFKPKACGGTDDPNYLVTSCIICNSMKGATEFVTLEEAKIKLRSYWDGEGMRQHWERDIRPLVESLK